MHSIALEQDALDPTHWGWTGPVQQTTTEAGVVERWTREGHQLEWTRAGDQLTSVAFDGFRSWARDREELAKEIDEAFHLAVGWAVTDNQWLIKPVPRSASLWMLVEIAVATVLRLSPSGWIRADTGAPVAEFALLTPDAVEALVDDRLAGQMAPAAQVAVDDAVSGYRAAFTDWETRIRDRERAEIAAADATRRRDEIDLARDIASDARGEIERTGKGGAALLAALSFIGTGASIAALLPAGHARPAAGIVFFALAALFLGTAFMVIVWAFRPRLPRRGDTSATGWVRLVGMPEPDVRTFFHAISQDPATFYRDNAAKLAGIAHAKHQLIRAATDGVLIGFPLAAIGLVFDLIGTLAGWCTGPALVVMTGLALLVHQRATTTTAAGHVQPVPTSPQPATPTAAGSAAGPGPGPAN
jgi:hypothetical protein